MNSAIIYETIVSHVQKLLPKEASITGISRYEIGTLPSYTRNEEMMYYSLIFNPLFVGYLFFYETGLELGINPDPESAKGYTKTFHEYVNPQLLDQISQTITTQLIYVKPTKHVWQQH